MLTLSSSDLKRLSDEDLQLYCECEMELATVADQRLSTITAAKHIFNIMKHIEMTSLLDDTTEYDFVVLFLSRAHSRLYFVLVYFANHLILISHDFTLKQRIFDIEYAVSMYAANCRSCRGHQKSCILKRVLATQIQMCL